MSELKEMFDKQIKFQKRLNSDIESQEFKTMMILSSIDELMEALRETPWKNWKKNQQYNQEKFKEELVDVLHFFINLCLSAGLTPEELTERFMNKNKENNKRQDDGY